MACKHSFLLEASQFEVYSASLCSWQSPHVAAFVYAPTAGKQHTRKSWERDLGLETIPKDHFWHDDVIYARKYYTKKLTHFKLIWLNRSLVKSTKLIPLLQYRPHIILITPHLLCVMFNLSLL